MPLTIIKGPPNSGRTELVRERFEARLADGPVLVVPSTDDIFGWERRLTRERGAFLGGKVVHFKDLIDEVLQGEGDGRQLTVDKNIASPIRRRLLAAQALDESWPLVKTRRPKQPGLVDAALRLFDELRENLIDREELATRVEAADGRVPAELVAAYRAYLDTLDDSGFQDLPQLAVKSVKVPLGAWEGRPVFVAGFDDLTVQQLTLLTRLSEVTDVCIAITHEAGNPAMAITEGLLGRLREAGGEVTDETLRPRVPEDHTPLLFSLESAFLDPTATGSLEPDDSLVLLKSSGRRGEAEAVGAEIAELVSAGTNPGQIAIAIDVPGLNGEVFRDVLAGFEIPATLEAETKASDTAVGQAVINLLRAANSETSSPADLFALVRGPVGLDQQIVDEIEREVRRTGVELVDEIVGLFRERGEEHVPPGWDEVRSGAIVEAACSLADRAARNLIATSDGILTSATSIETQMSTAILEGCRELSAATGEVTPHNLIEALESGAIKTWAIPTANAVRIASPYSMRAKRVEHLFIASLQERNLGDDGGGPFLAAEGRSAIGLPEKTDPEEQERYLFYSCLSVPTRSLLLSTRTADVHGKTEFPSPMVGEVTRLFNESGSRLKVRRRTSSDIVFPAAHAPSRDELIRAFAAGSPMPSNLPVDLGKQEARLAAAMETDALTRNFGPLESSEYSEKLASEALLSASQLESFIECPYKWFFERALKTIRFGPEPEAIARGKLIHLVLARLYEARLTDGESGSLPRPDDVHDWVAQAATLTIEAAGDDEIRLGSKSADHQIERQRVTAEISRYLFRESRRSNPGFHPAFLEEDFEIRRSDLVPSPSGEISPWKIRGIIDRVDLGDDENSGVIFDYKSGSSSVKTMRNMRKEGKVQLHLYMVAASKIWNLDVLGGLYIPVFRGNGRPRGIISDRVMVELPDLKAYSEDIPEDFAAELGRGLIEADKAANQIIGGDIRHRQNQCLKHFHHAGVPDWKLSDADGSGV